MADLFLSPQEERIENNKGKVVFTGNGKDIQQFFRWKVFCRYSESEILYRII